MLFFSIVIPTLNEEKNITKILEDISKQSFKDFEVLITDGNSLDATKEVVESYMKVIPHLKFISSPKRGICFQRNYGASKAGGKFLIFLDADVRISRKYLSEIYKTIQKNKVVFLTTYQLPDQKNQLDTYLAELANYTLEMLVLIKKQQAPGYNFVVDRELFHLVGGFDEEAVFCEDHELSIRLWKKKRVRLHIINQHLLKWSFRRLRKDGRLPIIYKYSVATLHMIVLGKITDLWFSYPMGGNYFKMMKKLPSKSILSTFKREIKKLIEFE